MITPIVVGYVSQESLADFYAESHRGPLEDWVDTSFYASVLGQWLAARSSNNVRAIKCSDEIEHHSSMRISRI